jgi:glucokinase
MNIVAKSKTDEICRLAIGDFCFGLGVFAGQLALNPLSFGGVYIMGVHEKLGQKFNRAAFMDGMRQNDLPHLIDMMPVSLVTAETPAFNGLQYVARKLRL